MLNQKGQTLEEFLKTYDPGRYERPSVTVDMVVLTDTHKALLIRRKDHPNIGTWALPGGFINMGETLYESAARELMEETGVTGVPLRSLGMYGEPSRDPRTRIITAAFCAAVPEAGLKIQAGDDAAEARLFAYELIPLGRVKIPPREERYPEIALPATATGEQVSGEGDGFALVLTCGELRLSALIAVSRGISALLPGRRSDSDGKIAGDHPLILFDAVKSTAML